MSTNEKTTSVADALTAAELTSPRVLNAAHSQPSKEHLAGATLDAVPASEVGDLVQKTASDEGDILETGGDTSFSSKIQWVDTESLHVNQLSDNIYGSDVPAALLASIKENDIQSPLIVSKAGMRVLSGNTRLRVALQLSIKKVPVLFFDKDLTDEEEQNLVLSHNVAREKTNEMRVREYKCYLDIEKKRAKQRVSAERKGPAKVQNFAPSKSREIAAEKVGASHTSLETGVKVVEAIDRLLELGESDNAKRLRKVLEENGYSRAKTLAVNQNWITEDAIAKASKTRQSAKSAQKSPLKEQSERPQELSQSDVSVPERGEDAPTNPAVSERADDTHATLPVVDPSKVESAFEQMMALETFLRDVDSAQFTDEVQTRIGAGIGKINAAALIAGFTIKGV